ncbi:Pycsar system effector family protein [Streptomyces uncialis]|uniref:Pycsar system effector family protein n=1 Tax=Streptomyces uncialis TaxID=1048205 RepID=UPI0037A5385B
MSDGGDPIRTRPEDDVSEGALSRELIAQNQHEIGRADGKAAILLVTGVSLVGLLFVHRPTAPGLLWWTASATTTTAIVCLLLALFPRGRVAPGRDVLAHTEDIVHAHHRASLTTALRRDTADPRPRLHRSLTETSRIARTKNRCIRHAVRLLLPAVLATLLTPLASR